MLPPIASLILTLAVSVQDAPVDPEVQARARLRVHAESLCETRPRLTDESVAACADRRSTALLATYGSAVAAIAAVGTPFVAPPTPSSNVVTVEGFTGRALGEQPLADPPSLPAERCRRDTTRTSNGAGATTTVVCGDTGETDRRVREMLDDAMSRH